RSVFVVGHAAVADFEHVRIVPMSRRSPRSQFVLLKTDLGHRVPGVANVSRGTPGIAAYLGSPLPHIIAAILTKAVENWTPRFQKRLTHLLVNGLHFLIGINIASATPVVLQIVDAPRRIGPCVLFFVAVTAFVSGTGIGAGRRI